MGWIKKVQEFATGKTELERKQEAAANKIIREKVMAAQLQERQRQAIKFAQERERISYEQRLKSLKQPVQRNTFGSSPRFDALGSSSFGGMVFGRQSPVVSKPMIATKRKAKKKGKKRRVYSSVPIQKPRFNVI
jgi:hypothetical protein